MILKHFNEASSILQLDGDEPSANRDVIQGITVGPAEKEAEHKDYLGGEYRSANIEKVMRAIKDYRKKHPVKQNLGEVTSAAAIPSEKIKSIIDLLKVRDKFGRGSYLVLAGTPSNPGKDVEDWLDSTKKAK